MCYGRGSLALISVGLRCHLFCTYDYDHHHCCMWSARCLTTPNADIILHYSVGARVKKSYYKTITIHSLPTITMVSQYG